MDIAVDGATVRIWYASRPWGCGGACGAGWWASCGGYDVGPHRTRDAAVGGAAAVVEAVQS